MIDYVVQGTIGILILSAGLVYFVVLYLQKQEKQKAEILEISIKNQRNMLEASVESQEIVRRQIGGDLHDDIGTLLSATRLSLAQVGKQLKIAKIDYDQFEHVNQLLLEAMTNVRSISKDLMPSTLDEFGLVVALRDLVSKFEKNQKIKVLFNNESTISDEFVIEKKKELVFFRVAQELLNNAIKHAKATEVMILLKVSFENLILIVQDNGVGFDINQIKNDPQKGLGLKNIEGRMSVIDGDVNFESTIGEGSITMISVKL